MALKKRKVPSMEEIPYQRKGTTPRPRAAKRPPASQKQLADQLRLAVSLRNPKPHRPAPVFDPVRPDQNIGPRMAGLPSTWRDDEDEKKSHQAYRRWW